MKRILCLLLVAGVIAVSACGASESDAASVSMQTGTDDQNAMMKLETEEEGGMMTITVNGIEFQVELEENETAKAFAAKLPLTLDMSELNGNEKYHYLGSRLPSNPERVGHIEIGDLMLYGSDCIVLFYESFGTLYTYTRIGRVKDPDGLKEAVGSSDAEVTFE